MSNDYPYIGWIPCVSGKLLFNYQECGYRKSSKFAYIKHTESLNDDSYIKHIFVCSSLKLKDNNSKYKGNFVFILASIVDSNKDVMEGDLYIVSKKIYNSQESLKNIILEAKKFSVFSNYILNDLKKLYSNLNNFQHDKYYKVKFKIDRHGFTELVYLGKDYGRVNEDTIIRQSFYYLKYSLHKHQHHDHDDDSLTTTHLKPDNNHDIGMLLLNDLKHSLVKLKRNIEDLKKDTVQSALGIISYSKSLIESCHRKNYIPIDEYSRQTNYFNNVGESINIKLEELKNKLSLKEVLWKKLHTLILFILAIIGPIVIIFKDEIYKRVKVPAKESLELIANFCSIILDLKYFIIVTLILGFIYVKKQLLILRLMNRYLNIFSVIHNSVRNAWLTLYVIVFLSFGFIGYYFYYLFISSLS